MNILDRRTRAKETTRLACTASLLVGTALSSALGPLVNSATAQPVQIRGDTSQAGALRASLDCRTRGCDRDYFITELPWVNWVRDRQTADVHILVTTLDTGGGGQELTVTLLGQRRYQAQRDTLRTSTLPAAPEDAVRRELARLFQNGLLRYAASTPLASRLRVVYDPAGQQGTSPAAVRDPWNFWTFTAQVNGSVNGESQQSFGDYYAGLSAQRITTEWRARLAVDGSYARSRYTLRGSDSAASDFVNIVRGYSAGAHVVRSFGAHVSAGLITSASRSDYFNQDLALRIAPAIEYNVFPWTDATRRQLTAAYSVGPAAFAYQRRTIFELTRETRVQQTAVLALASRQAWGSADAALRASSYLHDIRRSNIAFGGRVDLRLVQWLSLQLAGNVARVRDQLYLPGEGLSNEQILVRQRALATDYRYDSYVGVSYTFGSIYNSVVNPRLTELFGGSS